jgi:hypothetical protein
VRNYKGFWTGFIDTYTFTQFRTAGNFSAIAILHTFQLTVVHALGFSVFTSRVLATDLSQSHCHFNSHMTSSWHSLIPLFPFPANSEDSAQFPSDYCSLFLQLLNSQFNFSNLILATNTLSLYSLGSDPIENTVFSCRILCYLATCCSTVHREHSSLCCLFTGIRILSRCLAVGRYVTIQIRFVLHETHITSLLQRGTVTVRHEN